jgi:D-alanyl-D-alanine carboxypeptidase
MRSGSAVSVLVAALLSVVGCESSSMSSSLAPAARLSGPPSIGTARHLPPGPPPHAEGRVALGVADGVVPDGVTVFDATPAVTKLDPLLLRALHRAATDAGRDKVVFYVDSGWRSRAYQEQLLRQAITKYGSRKKAARWVATPGTSAHVSGDAIDIGHDNARSWLSRHGAKYGLCRIYRNEPWHYELRPHAIERGCPAMYADPTQDPRMQQ